MNPLAAGGILTAAGTAVGAGAGAIHSKSKYGEIRTKDVLLGGAAGAAFGLATGMLAQNGIDDMVLKKTGITGLQETQKGLDLRLQAVGKTMKQFSKMSSADRAKLLASPAAKEALIDAADPSRLSKFQKWLSNFGSDGAKALAHK